MDPTAIKTAFRSLLTMGGATPPLDEMCYLICQLGGFEIDIPAEQHRLEFAALQLPPTFEGVVSGLFSGPSALRGNVDDYYSLRNSMLSEVQRTGLGIPITLSVLAIEHARRIGVPINGIGLPGHFIIGSGNDPDLFADPFNSGALLDRDGVRRLHQQVGGQNSNWSESFLVPVPARDILFRILNNIRVVCTRNFADRGKLPWVLELLSWFPLGGPFDAQVAARAVAPFN